MVTLGKVSSDQHGVRRFPEGLKPNSCKRRLDRFRMTPVYAELVSQALEGVKPQLAHTLPVIHKPFVVPVRKQIQGQVRPGQLRQLGAYVRSAPSAGASKRHQNLSVDPDV